MQVAEIREVGQIAENIVGQHRTVHTIECLETLRRIFDGVARGHQNIVLGLVPHLCLSLYIVRTLTLRQKHFIAAQQHQVFIPRRDVDASPITIVRRPNFAACAAIAREQTIDVDARDFPAAARTLHRRIGIVENAFECIGDVDAHAHRAIERARQIFAFVGNATGLLGILLVDAVARFICRIRAIRKRQTAAIVSQIHIYLYAGAGRFAQAPFTARSPIAVLLIHCARGRAHHGHFADATLDGACGWHIDRHRQIHQRH